MDRHSLSLALESKLADKWVKISRKQIESAIITMWEIIFDELAKWNEVRIHKFANFSVTQRKPRRWINPVTMETVMVPAHKTIKIAISSIIKRRVNGK